MSVRDNSKVINLIDGLTGEVIDVIDCSLYSNDTILFLIEDVFTSYLIENDRGLIIKAGYKS